MSFVSPAFLWFFLPVVLALLLSSPASWRNRILLVASVLFYVIGAGGHVLLLLGTVAASLLAASALRRRRAAGESLRPVVVVAVTFLLGLLAIWKYAGFVGSQLEVVGRWMGFDPEISWHLALPVGISFFVFQAVSYVIDVYRGDVEATDGETFAVYLMMFPQLVAGPIVRYSDVRIDLANRYSDRLHNIAAGYPRFAFGICKKVLVADTLAPLADAAFLDPSKNTAITSLVGVMAYTLQIYFDFSGYSDMAIGLAQMFGIGLPENFARPYSAASLTDFWRRWHITLSSWFRDYVYIPLGGNRGTARQTLRNLLIVFLLTGMWHGANWTFVLWGLAHGVVLLIERASGVAHRDGPEVGGRVRTFGFVALAWVLFRAPTVGDALDLYASLTRWGPASGLLRATLDTHVLLVLLAASVVVLLPAGESAGRSLQRVGGGRTIEAARLGLCTLGIALAGLTVAAGSFSPFLYFQF